MQFRSVTRRALLLGAPGFGQNYLHGVLHDMNNINSFLVSPNGGSWHPREIYTIPYATFEDVSYYIKNIYADYLLVYFSGHGGTVINPKTRVLKLQDRLISDHYLLRSQSPKQNIIVDSCRNYIGGVLGGISPQYGDPFTCYDGSHLARKAFDYFIAMSNPGKQILHSTKEGLKSYDSSTGGYFTKTLLSVSNTFISRNHKVFPLSVSKLASYVPPILVKQGINQFPEVTYEKGNLTVPFALALPQEEAPVLVNSNNRTTQKRGWW